MRVVALGTALVGVLVLGAPPDSTRPVRPRTFDAPDAAARDARGRRAPLDARIDVTAAYDRAAAARLGLTRFASRIGRTLPGAMAPAAVWTSASRAIALNGAAAPTALLDAWTPLGPGNIGGRTRVVRYHPTRRSTLFAAGVSGGVWRSDDDGGSWRPSADGMTNLTVNALAIDSRTPDVMYAGTGEGYFREEIRGTGLPLRGTGIFATRDGGASWRRLAATANDNFLWVNDLELGVGDSRRIYAATRTGVWRSLDAGDTWTQLLATVVRGGCLDLAIRPDHPDDTLFASCGSYDQGTVYRLANAGGKASPEVVLSESGMGRTSLAIAASRPDTMYALTASNDPGPDGNYEQGLLAVYRSDSGGAPGSWQTRVTNTSPTRLNTLLLTNVSGASAQECSNGQQPNNFITMGWYNNVIAVDPRDPERVWAAGVDWFRSDDGGRNWGIASSQAGNMRTLTAYAHVDQHAITFHPDYDGQGNQIVLIGNDGGVFRTANARATTSRGPRAGCSTGVATIEVRWESLNRDYGVTQFYYGLPFPDGTRYVGGAQDNGTPAGSDDGGVNAWQSLFGGDGGYVAVHPANPQILYAESQWANVGRSLNGGTTFTVSTRGLDAVRSSTLGPDANYLFVAPFVMDPANPNRLWVGGEHLYRTTDSAANWTKASTAMPDGGLVSTMAIDATESNHVIAGTHRGDFVSTRSALSATAATDWVATRPRDGWMTSVSFDPRNTNTIYATYGNFGGAHVYRSADGGASWSALAGFGSGMLPDIPVHSIVVDPDDGSRLYLGTDLGVFVSTDRGARWMAEETGFGPVVTEWLALQRDTAGRKRLYAFTHGRGVWRVELR
jgi:hypothetical protein